jgi:hypothetical protein
MAADEKVGRDEAEEDVWWGSYSLWAIVPGCVACLLATALLACLLWLSLPPYLSRPAFLGIGGVLWLTQGIRWSRRVFGYSYRLTSRRLFCHRGLQSAAASQTELGEIASVAVSQCWYERLVGVGRIAVRLNQSAQPAMILTGVRNPAAIAAEIRASSQRDRPSA